MADSEPNVGILMRANTLLVAWLAGALQGNHVVSVADIQDGWEAAKMIARREAGLPTKEKN